MFETRRTEIVAYIRGHAGCSAKQVHMALYHPHAWTITYFHLRELAATNVIYYGTYLGPAHFAQTTGQATRRPRGLYVKEA